MATPQSRLNAVPPTVAHSSRLTLIGGACLALAYCVCWALVETDRALLEQLWFLPGVGVIGAIIANASGTGGGVVFVPVFNALRDLGVMAVGPLQVVAVSMGIRLSE